MKNIFGLILILFLYVGCEEIDVPFVSDAAEVERYLAEDDLAKIFFSTKNLISEQPYNYPFDTTGYYVDLLDSIDRRVVSFFPLKEFGAGYADPSQEFGPPFGSSQDAEVEVRDRVYARTIRVEGTDTTFVNELVFRDYTRYGYFMKLGSDGQRFSGWLLRGFNGGSPDRGTRMSMFHANNQWFPGDTSSYQHQSSYIVNNAGFPPDTIREYTTTHGYVMLNGNTTTSLLIERVALGEKLRYEITTTLLGVFYTMSYTTADTTILENFVLNGSNNFEVPIQTPPVNNNVWDFIYFQEFVRDINDTTAVPKFQTFKRRNWVIPFKVE